MYVIRKYSTGCPHYFDNLGNMTPFIENAAVYHSYLEAFRIASMEFIFSHETALHEHNLFLSGNGHEVHGQN